MDEDVRHQFEALTRRVQRLEDELAIHRVIMDYCFAVDSGDAERAAALFTEDTVYDSEVMMMHGRDEVRRMVLSDRHQALLPNCAHTIGPISVDLQGDHAVAIGYSRLYLRKDNDIELWRLSFNRWELARGEGGWRVARRSTRVLGHAEAQRLFRQRP